MDRTKAAIIEAFQQLLEETPINKITVKSLVERCGINRNTFYYHFNGIPDLVEYQMTMMADQLLDSFEEPNLEQEIREVVTYLTQKKKAILHAYRYYPREQLLLMLDRVALYVVDGEIARATEQTPIDEEDRTILVRFYKSALVGVMLDWMENGMRYDMNVMAERLYQLMKGSTQRAIEKSRRGNNE